LAARDSALCALPEAWRQDLHAVCEDFRQSPLKLLKQPDAMTDPSNKESPILVRTTKRLDVMNFYVVMGQIYAYQGKWRSSMRFGFCEPDMPSSRDERGTRFSPPWTAFNKSTCPYSRLLVVWRAQCPVSSGPRDATGACGIRPRSLSVGPKSCEIAADLFPRRRGPE
jgi:hypothetical protein